MEHTPFYLHSFPLKRKKTHTQVLKQKTFILQSLQTPRDLAQHLYINLIMIHPTPPHEVTFKNHYSFILELYHSTYFNVLCHEFKLARSLDLAANL